MSTLQLLIPAMLLLAACTPTATDAAGAPKATMTETNPTPASTSIAASPATPADAGTMPVSSTPFVEPISASISGSIRDGNRPPPALRVCATPVDGGAPMCIDTGQGANSYRVDVAPGRYYLLGWTQSGELALIAHASQIRCIRAPCPPDELIEITVEAGEQREGIDLNGGYADVPDGWPQRQG